MMLELAATFLVRTAQVLASAMPTILLGMLASGVLVRAVGPHRVGRWLASGSPADALRAWMMGILLPVCPLGVIPVLFTLRRMGVGAGALGIVALSGPLVTPWTIGYLADRAGWSVALILLLANALISMVAFLAIGRSDRAPGVVSVAEGGGSSMLLGTLAAAGRSITTWASGAIALAVVGAGIVAICIPPNAVGEWLVERSASHAATVIAIALGTVVLPPTLALHAGEIARGSTMPGLMVPVISLGAGMNLGVLALACATAGVKRSAIAFVAVVVAASVMGVLVDRVTYDRAYVPEDSHAFEDLGRPFHLLEHPDGAVAGWWHRFTRVAGVESLAGSVGVLVLVLLSRTRAPRPTSTADGPLPRAPLQIAGVIGAVGVVVAILYSYYPPPATATREIRVLFSELMSSESSAATTRLRARILHRLQQLPRSAVLYAEPLSESQHAAMERLGQRIAAHTGKSTGRLADEDIEALRDIGSLSGSHR